MQVAVSTGRLFGRQAAAARLLCLRHGRAAEAGSGRDARVLCGLLRALRLPLAGVPVRAAHLPAGAPRQAVVSAQCIPCSGSTAAHGEPACLSLMLSGCVCCVTLLLSCAHSLVAHSHLHVDCLALGYHLSASCRCAASFAFCVLSLTGHCLGRAADRLWPVAVCEVQQHGAAEPAAQGPAGAADHAGRPRAHHRVPAQGPAAPPELTLDCQCFRIAAHSDGVSGH